MERRKKQSKFNLILQESYRYMTLRSNCSIGSKEAWSAVQTDSQVMNEDQLPENRKEVDDQDPKHITVKLAHGQTIQTSRMAQNLGEL